MLAGLCKVLASCASGLDITFVLQALLLWHEVVDGMYVR